MEIVYLKTLTQKEEALMGKHRILMVMAAILLAVVGLVSASEAEPTSAKGPYVHSVWSEKPVDVIVWGRPLPVQSGNSVASWTSLALQSANPAFFNAIVEAGGNIYEFRLVGLPGSATQDEITGRFDIYENYVLVARVKGGVYGLSQPVGGAFKFVDSSGQWALAAVITNRFDY